MRTSNNRVIYLLGLFLILIAAIWYVSAETFPHKKNVDAWFGLASEQVFVFNERLFVHLGLALVSLFLCYLYGYSQGTRLTFFSIIMTLMLAVAVGSFLIGVNLPITKITRFWIFENEQSLIQLLTQLRRDGETMLYLIMLVFTFCVPVLKFLMLMYQILIRPSSFTHGALSFISRWAMIDVLVVAVVVAAMKSTNGVVEISTQSGLGYFAASVVITILLTAMCSMKNRGSEIIKSSEPLDKHLLAAKM